jgi:ribose/xylose/arabinose/galactoside ABC-type transport system permease subunit
MRVEILVNAALACGLLAVPLLAHVMGEPFIITLATRAAMRSAAPETARCGQ